MPPRKRASVDKDDSPASAKKQKTEPTRRSQRNAGKAAVISAVDTKSSTDANSSDTKAPSKAEPKPSQATPKQSKKGAEKSRAKPASTTNGSTIKSDTTDEPSYWLMKAEPESRIEKGKDVKFSIDDLAAVAKEPWDGVRNPIARNNMRAMKKGEKAFFYHSNCKIPGIAGFMEIADEWSVDESAFDPEHPYYDEKSSRNNPKWSVVHVRFLKKLDKLISLKELQKYGQPGSELAGMQVLRMSRLSVSKVSAEEWEFICKELAKVDPDSLESIE